MLYSIYHVLMGGGGGAVGASAKRKIKPLPNLEHVLKMEFPLGTFQITNIHHGPHLQVQMNFIKFINYVQLRHNSYSMASEYHYFSVLQKTEL